jgi:hypothetical protein
VIFVAVALLVIGLATLLPAPGPTHPWVFCLACGGRGTADLLFNIALFMPLGAALALRGRRLSFIMMFGAALSTAIEVSQFYIPGRDPTVGDIVANTAGAVLGALVIGRAAVWLSPTRAVASWLCRGAAALAALICLATGVLLTPSFPRSRYFGLLTPQLRHLERYQGRILDAMIDNTPIDSAETPLAERIRELLQSRGGFELRVRAVAGPRPSSLSPLLAILDDRRHEILLLGVDRDEVVLRLWTRAAGWRFDRPDVRAHALRAVQSGDTVLLNVVAQGGTGSGYTINGIEDGFTAGLGWTLLTYPGSLRFKDVLSAIWIGALFVPAGFWWRNRGDGLVVVVGLLSGLLLVPALTPLLPTPPLEWIAAGLGLAVGVALRRWRRLPSAFGTAVAARLAQ